MTLVRGLWWRLTALTVILAGLMLVGVAGHAGAHPVAQTVGQVTLFVNPDFSGQPQVITYGSCRPGPSRLVRQVGSYLNQPLAGCQVVLRNATGAEHILCAGRAVVPPGFRQGPRVIIRQGTSPACGPIIATA